MPSTPTARQCHRQQPQLEPRLVGVEERLAIRAYEALLARGRQLDSKQQQWRPLPAAGCRAAASVVRGFDAGSAPTPILSHLHAPRRLLSLNKASLVGDAFRSPDAQQGFKAELARACPRSAVGPVERQNTTISVSWSGCECGASTRCSGRWGPIGQSGLRQVRVHLDHGLGVRAPVAHRGPAPRIMWLRDRRYAAAILAAPGVGVLSGTAVLSPSRARRRSGTVFSRCRTRSKGKASLIGRSSVGALVNRQRRFGGRFRPLCGRMPGRAR